MSIRDEADRRVDLFRVMQLDSGRFIDESTAVVCAIVMTRHIRENPQSWEHHKQESEIWKELASRI